MKLDERAVFLREAAQITALLERLNDLIVEFMAAPREREPALKAEIEEAKERIKRFAFHYQN